MIRGLIVVDGIVDNVAVFNSEDDLSDGWQIAPDGIGPGATDNGDGTFTNPVIEETE